MFSIISSSWRSNSCASAVRPCAINSSMRAISSSSMSGVTSCMSPPPACCWPSSCWPRSASIRVYSSIASRSSWVRRAISSGEAPLRIASDKRSRACSSRSRAPSSEPSSRRIAAFHSISATASRVVADRSVSASRRRIAMRAIRKAEGAPAKASSACHVTARSTCAARARLARDHRRSRRISTKAAAVVS